MGKVPNDKPLVNRLLALDPDTGTAAQGAVGVILVGAVHAELDGILGRVDGRVAVGQGAGQVLITGERDGYLVKGKLLQTEGIESTGVRGWPSGSGTYATKPSVGSGIDTKLKPSIKACPA